MSTDQAMLPCELQTGVSEMDSQHENLFHQIQALKSMLTSPEADEDKGLAILRALDSDMAEHFLWEEEEAARIGIDFDEHTLEHHKILALLNTRIAELQNGNGNIPALLVFLDRLFEMHVTHFDQTLGAELRAADRALAG